MQDTVLQVSEFVDYLNQTLDVAYPEVIIEGEVSSFNINQGKFVFFDIKDKQASLPCFLMVFQLKVQLEDGMLVRVRAKPKLRNNGRFSLTVSDIQPVGEGNLRRAFELLRAKLDKEGLFAPERKRSLPPYPKRIGVISSETAAGYGDFLTILEQRWGGLEIILAQVQVQGEAAPDQIVRAIHYFNELPEPVDVLAIIRGGGSLEDLQPFNTEPVARAIAGSRTPIIVGVGHEEDITLADLAADVRAATPTDAAGLIVPSRQEMLSKIDSNLQQLSASMRHIIDKVGQDYQIALENRLRELLDGYEFRLQTLERTLRAYNPRTILAKGYGIVRKAGTVIKSGRGLRAGDTIEVELIDTNISAEVKDAHKKT